ncbi:MAG TPA: ABATE domain-containing protein [Streptosporangiaceae bacterium]|jgi:predicted RNA-binding Zn ribbon-like protein|nr:ABATE domain-containing protein [Streptosporangiaceae bacterium]
MSVEVPSRAWMLPDEPVAVRLMSTIWAGAEGLRDDLQTPQDVDAWLDAVGVERAGARATNAEFTKARGLRDAVRRLAAFVTADPSQAAAAASALGDALGQVNAIAAEAPAPALTLRGGHLEQGTQAHVSPVTAGLARVAEDSIGLLGGDGAARLRACRAPGCVLYFVKTHPRREWCSVACGNRVRAARHYQRVRSSPSRP